MSAGHNPAPGDVPDGRFEFHFFGFPAFESGHRPLVKSDGTIPGLLRVRDAHTQRLLKDAVAPLSTAFGLSTGGAIGGACNSNPVGSNGVWIWTVGWGSVEVPIAGEFLRGLREGPRAA